MGHTLTDNEGTQAEKENMPISKQPSITCLHNERPHGMKLQIAIFLNSTGFVLNKVSKQAK